ncbi:hypothetical protein D3C87_1367410 [compost metagenome]
MRQYFIHFRKIMKQRFQVCEAYAQHLPVFKCLNIVYTIFSGNKATNIYNHIVSYAKPTGPVSAISFIIIKAAQDGIVYKKQMALTCRATLRDHLLFYYWYHTRILHESLPEQARYCINNFKQFRYYFFVNYPYLCFPVGFSEILPHFYQL